MMAPMNESEKRGEPATPPPEPREKDKSGEKAPPPFERPMRDGPAMPVRRMG